MSKSVCKVIHVYIAAINEVGQSLDSIETTVDMSQWSKTGMGMISGDVIAAREA